MRKVLVIAGNDCWIVPYAKRQNLNCATFNNFELGQDARFIILDPAKLPPETVRSFELMQLREKHHFDAIILDVDLLNLGVSLEDLGDLPIIGVGAEADLRVAKGQIHHVAWAVTIDGILRDIFMKSGSGKILPMEPPAQTAATA